MALLCLMVLSCIAPEAPSDDRGSTIQNYDNDRFEIFELAYKYADAANRKDGELFQSLWADDNAQWVLGPPINKTFEGKAEMGSSVTYMLNLWDFFVQMVNGGVVEIIDDTHANARFYVSERANSKEGSGNFNLSMYEDKLIKKDGKWYFQKRTYKTIFQSSEINKGQVFGSPVLDTE